MKGAGEVLRISSEVLSKVCPGRLEKTKIAASQAARGAQRTRSSPEGTLLRYKYFKACLLRVGAGDLLWCTLRGESRVAAACEQGGTRASKTVGAYRASAPSSYHHYPDGQDLDRV